MPESKDQNQSHSLFHAFFRGAIAGVVEVGLNHPLFQLKLLTQTDGDTSKNPGRMFVKSVRKGDFPAAQSFVAPMVKSLYKDIGSYAGSMVPTTALQISVTQLATNTFNAHTSMHPYHIKLAAGFIGGAAAAGFASPTEYILAQVKKHRELHPSQPISAFKMTQQMFQQQGYRVLTHGLFGTATRDGMFVVGYNALVPISRDKLDLTIKTPWISTAIANTVFGSTVALASQPFDSIKCHQQSTGRYTFWGAAKALYAKEYPKDSPRAGQPMRTAAFFQGGTARTIRVVSALAVIDKVNRTYDATVASKKM